MKGYIATYCHNDSTSKGKAGSLVRVLTDTDFSHNIPDFVNFSAKIAMIACGVQESSWKELLVLYPALEDERQKLSTLLKEDVIVDEIMVMYGQKEMDMEENSTE